MSIIQPSGKLSILEVVTKDITVTSNMYTVNLNVNDLCEIGTLVVQEYIKTKLLHVSGEATTNVLTANSISVSNLEVSDTLHTCNVHVSNEIVICDDE